MGFDVLLFAHQHGSTILFIVRDTLKYAGVKGCHAAAYSQMVPTKQTTKPAQTPRENNKANVEKYELLGNLGKGCVEILCTVTATFQKF